MIAHSNRKLRRPSRDVCPELPGASLFKGLSRGCKYQAERPAKCAPLSLLAASVAAQGGAQPRGCSASVVTTVSMLIVLLTVSSTVRTTEPTSRALLPGCAPAVYSCAHPLFLQHSLCAGGSGRESLLASTFPRASGPRRWVGEQCPLSSCLITVTPT